MLAACLGGERWEGGEVQSVYLYCGLSGKDAMGSATVFLNMDETWMSRVANLPLTANLSWSVDACFAL
jgi:hypothetical protein